MNKTIYIIIIGIILLLTVITFTILNQGSQISGKIDNVVYTDLDITFKPSSGSNIVTGNFLNNSSVTPDDQNPGLYELGKTINVNPAIEKIPNYTVIYDKETGVFNVSLLQKPFGQSRFEAESYLKSLLQISEIEMCELSYSVTVPGFVDQNASGIDYRFSFCPDATSL